MREHVISPVEVGMLVDFAQEDELFARRVHQVEADRDILLSEHFLCCTQETTFCCKTLFSDRSRLRKFPRRGETFLPTKQETFLADDRKDFTRNKKDL